MLEEIAKTVAREQKRSLGRVVSDFITGAIPPPGEAAERDEDDGFPTFRCTRRMTSEDVKDVLDEEG